MIFETKYIKELFNLVSNYHNNLDFYKVFLENVKGLKNHNKGKTYQVIPFQL
jgi:site-specific DNA-cytosine methylase